ncbi:TPA: ABC-F family ATP-binding cassette domain-containing protein [Clostridioides difficile]|uniref:ABC-F type ribosomal protection protein CplR n=1 Tax=Clostridioides difficile TaxID=1496 RepID=UPI000C9B046A|nr:ABC-F type ribosomal protection protein CplR [Clostridioides difficile]MCP3280502.1 ATP-binding cassette domain-containing protein [Clostridioides difficile]MDK3393237.1 ABC-F family ATP-binding cassette domain-containing protein [Clostridioides difficile]NMU17293.1 ABC-F family ATP-binding cassette domain-containing protein [Clostridioides difficile]HBE9249113.1 ABC-F family ATP-binding cassette domain-containing protein [Clostridioides difficile]HBE9291183.1 ABC-F family ATP-binding casse
MLLVKVENLKKYYADKLILDIDKLEILENDKIGLVGSNGQGKTTLLKAILGEIEIDEGYTYLTESYSYISQSENNIETCSHSKEKSLLNAPDKFEEYLSGGEKVKLKIADALSNKKNIIIADEPTSNLDKKSIGLLEDMFKRHEGALLLISHDRRFLDELCTTILELEDGKLKAYKGNYTDYLMQKDEEVKRADFEYQEYVKEKKRLEKALLYKKALSDGIRKTPKRMGNSEARLHKMGGQTNKKKLDSNVKAIKSRIDKLEVKNKPKVSKEMNIKIQDGMEIISKNLLEVKDMTLKLENKLLLDNVSFKIKRGKKIALLGDNGCGKSTLIKEILADKNDNIKINNKVKVGYFDQNQSLLDEEKSVLYNTKVNSSFDESFIRINLSLFGFKGDDVYKKVKVLSGGEKVKIALCKIILEDNNFLVFDEPTNYLDIKSMEALEKALINTDKTMLIVSHDRVFVSHICNYIIEIKDAKIREFDCNYDEYIISRNKKTPSRDKQIKKENLLVLENRLTTVISMLSIEKDNLKKELYESEYNELLKQITKLKNSF